MCSGFRAVQHKLDARGKYRMAQLADMGDLDLSERLGIQGGEEMYVLQYIQVGVRTWRSRIEVKTFFEYIGETSLFVKPTKPLCTSRFLPGKSCRRNIGRLGDCSGYNRRVLSNLEQMCLILGCIYI